MTERGDDEHRPYYRRGAPMKEEAWLSSRDPIAMLSHLEANPNDRKPLLLMLAYLERIWDLSVPGPIRNWAEQASLTIEGRGDPAAFAASEEEACHYLAGLGPYYLREGIPPAACQALDCLFLFAAAEGDSWEPADSEGLRAEYAVQADLAREIFGNPSRPARIEPAWLTRDVVALARRVDAGRRFDLMPALGDALEEAGCDNAVILEHCRKPEGHVRGCWLVDTLLGKG